jgi:hypothetical protein
MSAGLLLAAAPLAAQSAVPVDEEPRHHLVFSNETIRVIDAALPPGYTSLYHVHDRDNIPIVVDAGRIRVQPLGGTATESDVTLGRVTYATGGYAHRVGNVDTGLVHFIDVELLGAEPATPAADPAPLPRHELVLQNRRVRAWRIVLAPNDTLPAHAHHRALLQVTVQGPPGAPPGTWHWVATGEPAALINPGPTAYELVEIEPLE